MFDHPSYRHMSIFCIPHNPVLLYCYLCEHETIEGQAVTSVAEHKEAMKCEHNKLPRMTKRQFLWGGGSHNLNEVTNL